MNIQTYLKNPNLFCQKTHIGSTWCTAKSGKTIRVINPFNGDFLGVVPDLSADEVRQVITYATDAQKEWAARTPDARAKILHAWADLIEQNSEDLAVIMTLEQGKPLAEARGEIAYGNSYIRYFAEEGKRVYGDIIPTSRTQLRYAVLKQPIGVCAAITPWNFPCAMITRKVAPALAAGCTMIVKPDSQTPFSALALMVLAQQAGIPDGVLQIVTGDAPTVGKVLTEDVRVAKLSFTGSTAVGRVLMAQCAPTVKKLSLELGGNAPFIVFADADVHKAVDGLLASKYRNAGQTCVCANRVYVHKSIKEPFLRILKQKVEALQIGNGMQPDTHIGPLINEAALHKVQRLLADAVQKGATIVTGGSCHAAGTLLFEPTVVADVTKDMDIAQEEIFGPIAPIFDFEEEEAVIQEANDTIYGLAAYFYTQDLRRSWYVAQRLEYGMVAQNTGILSDAVAPFGGVKQSGFGREGSKYGIEEYLTLKYWCMDIS